MSLQVNLNYEECAFSKVRAWLENNGYEISEDFFHIRGKKVQGNLIDRICVQVEHGLPRRPGGMRRVYGFFLGGTFLRTQGDVVKRLEERL